METNGTGSSSKSASPQVLTEPPKAQASSSPTTRPEQPVQREKPTVVTKPVEPVVDKEVEERRLEEEMRKRRERIEKWRNEKKLKEPVEKKVEEPKPTAPTSSKTWNLEDDDDEEDATAIMNKYKNVIEVQKPVPNPVAEAMNIKMQLEQQRQLILKQKQEKDQIQEQMERERQLLNKKVDDDEEDPLDKYMEEITKKADKQIRTNAPKAKTDIESSSGLKEESTEQLATEKAPEIQIKKFTIMSGVAKVKKDKGHIMEQDMDGLEYASEDESPSLENDVANMTKIKMKAVS
jgi:hypothetical protein